ncbi:MAG TPA: NUDIX hydrolase [Lachnospiraceae bacterium]
MEKWDIYNEKKEVTGKTMRRNDWNLKAGEYHLTVLAIIKRSDGKFLITKRVMTKAWAPGWWEVPGGAVLAGETSKEAVVREVREETGLDLRNAKGECFLTYQRQNLEEGDNYFVDVYGFFLDFTEEDLILQKEETMDYKIAGIEEIQELADKGVFLHYASIEKVFEKLKDKL